jgi:hypothetical protein
VRQSHHAQQWRLIEVQGGGKKPPIVVVNTRDEADVTIEVLDRGEVATGKQRMTKNAFGVPESTTIMAKHVRTKLSLGEYSTEIVGSDEGNDLMPATWSAAAGSVVTQVKKWVKDNDARIPRK